VNAIRNLLPRECFPKAGEILACVGCYVALLAIAWAVCLPHSWNGG